MFHPLTPRQREDYQTGDYTILPSYTFAQEELKALKILLNIKHSPYVDYAKFKMVVINEVMPNLPDSITQIGHSFQSSNHEDSPVLYLKNCPIDDMIPILNFQDPLNSKYSEKKNFISEAFLEVMSQLLGTTIVGYRTANNGDKFQDIVPMESLQDTPSQKTAGVLKFHADIPHNRVRADWVYLLSLRNPVVNEVYTCFARVKDALDSISPEQRSLLLEPIFFSCHDTIHVHGGRPAGFTAKRPLILTNSNGYFTTFFEGNTYCDRADGNAALEAFTSALYRVRYNLFLEKRDFVALPNKYCLHARHIVDMKDREANKTRWLLKTWNLDSRNVPRDFYADEPQLTIDE